MRSIKRYFKIYLMLVSQYLKARMHYRADFFISIFGILLTNLSGIVIIWIIFTSTASIGGVSYEQLMFMYAFSLLVLSPLQIFFDNIWNLRNHIIEGSFIKYYFRPLNMMFYYMSETIDIKGIAQLIFSIILIIYSSWMLQLQWTIVKILLFILFLFTSSLIVISLMIIGASLGFWIQNSYSVLIFIFKLKDFGRYPMTIFNNFFRFLFTFIIPIGFIAFYPLEALLDLKLTNFPMLLVPFIGPGLFLISYLVWKKGVKSYKGTGS